MIATTVCDNKRSTEGPPFLVPKTTQCFFKNALAAPRTFYVLRVEKGISFAFFTVQFAESVMDGAYTVGPYGKCVRNE